MAKREPRHYVSYSSSTQRWLDVSLYPDASGGVACFFRDATSRKQAEDELRHAKEEAERASLAKSEFLAALSHEMRTPLAPVVATLSLIECNPKFPDELRGDLEFIRRNVELEVQLISDILDLTRIEKGKLDLELTDVDLHEVLRAVVKMCDRAEAASIHLDLHAQVRFVRGDSIRLHQVFWNLITNAQKFTPPHGRITVRSISVGHRTVRVLVEDSGCGISADLLPRLFTAFEQGEPRAARQRGGLGLGLALSRKFIELHNGTISAESKGDGLGSTFCVDLPALSSNDPAQPARSVAPAENSASPLHVLLVEDHPPTLLAMKRLLTMMGHRVTAAGSVSAARNAAHECGCDFLISDLGLPDGSGFDLLREIGSQFAGRAIALSGYGMDSDVRAALSAGFAAHLTKPVQVTLLRSTIARLSGRT